MAPAASWISSSSGALGSWMRARDQLAARSGQVRQGEGAAGVGQDPALDGGLEGLGRGGGGEHDLVAIRVAPGRAGPQHPAGERPRDHLRERRRRGLGRVEAQLEGGFPGGGPRGGPEAADRVRPGQDHQVELVRRQLVEAEAALAVRVGPAWNPPGAQVDRGPLERRSAGVQDLSRQGRLTQGCRERLEGRGPGRDEGGQAGRRRIEARPGPGGGQGQADDRGQQEGQESHGSPRSRAAGPFRPLV